MKLRIPITYLEALKEYDSCTGKEHGAKPITRGFLFEINQNDKSCTLFATDGFSAGILNAPLAVFFDEDEPIQNSQPFRIMINYACVELIRPAQDTAIEFEVLIPAACGSRFPHYLIKSQGHSYEVAEEYTCDTNWRALIPEGELQKSTRQLDLKEAKRLQRIATILFGKKEASSLHLNLWQKEPQGVKVAFYSRNGAALETFVGFIADNSSIYPTTAEEYILPHWLTRKESHV